MKKTEVLLSINKLKKAFETLKEGTIQANSQLEKDGVGIECYSPRGCIKEAFKQGFIEDDEIFLDMLEDRNRSSHIYEETAEEIFKRIKEIYTETLEKAIKNLEEKLK
ncbi:MAG: putative nucleotidyltransferase [Thermodesulfobacterium sp.]|uniref:Nucleotidyltransferase n=1 Tax=Candidatus Thermodesulfobacterium syntrophicum TaxID=3060442 RepID=A0AAE3P138_9BACT|nr:putative nucleotidyltransferase [Candidatus Thermodesulfobacterium syntrophicum]